LRRELLVSERRRCEGRQHERRSQLTGQLSEWKRQANEDNAINVDPASLQGVSDARRARDAKAFTCEEERRVPRLEAVSIDADELGDRLGIATRLIELRAVFLLCGTAVARAYRINEHEVCLIQPRALIINRRTVGFQTPRPESQQMHE